ncbi:MAG: alpha/beta hydrolase [Anaerolineae bacterium]|nr:alpha/beta hydrolase [Anaerolineae bacterium]
MRKKLLIIGGIAVLVVLVLVAAVAGYFWYAMGQPLYKPGMVRVGKNLRVPLSPPVQSGDAGFWTVEEDIRLYHFSAGAGRNMLVVHGGPGAPHAEPWPGLEPLTGEYQFHYYDQRGCGQSTRPFDSFSSPNYYENMTTLERTLGMGAQLADIERIRRILGEEKLILIGHSYGGFMASLYAAEFPERVEALILIAPANMLVMPSEGPDLFAAVREKLPEDEQAEFDTYIEEYLDFGSVFSKSEDELVALNEEFAVYYALVVNDPLPAGGRSGGWMVPAIYMSTGLRHDYRDALKKVEAPVLVVHGSGDLQTEAQSRLYADLFPNATFRVIEGAEHFPFYNQPEQFAQVVEEFLSGLD